MAAPQLDIHIVEAELVRIFDSFKQSQDLYVQLVCGYEDGSEKNVGRTEVCKGTGKQPKWDERFLCGRGQGKTLKFKVFVDHMWRSPTLCGEAEYSLDKLWSTATSKKQKLAIALYKKEEQTGIMSITMRLQDNGSVSSMAPPSPVAAVAPAGFPQMPGQQVIARAGLAQHQRDPFSAGQEHQRIANVGMNYHIDPQMQPPIPQRQEEWRQTPPQAPELQRRPEERRQDMMYQMNPQIQPAMPHRQEERRYAPQPQEVQRRPEERRHDVNYHIDAQMQPPIAQRHEDRRQTPQAQDLQPQRHEDRRQTPQAQDLQAQRHEDRRHTPQAQDLQAQRREDRRQTPQAQELQRRPERKPSAPAQDPRFAMFEEDRGVPTSQPKGGGYNVTPTAGPRGVGGYAQQAIPQQQQAKPQAAAPMAPAQTPPTAAARMQPPQQQDQTRAEPAARSPPTAPPTAPQGAPKPSPQPAIGKSGAWWNSFIDRG